MKCLFQQISDVNNFFNERKKLGIQLGIDRTERLLQALNHPEKKFPAVHVAGTNGKGSTIHFASQALLENDYKVGVFTSPSLEGLTGHIYFNGKKMSDQHFLSLFQEVYPVIHSLDQQGVYATEFEIIAVMAFVYFAKYADIAFIETGMGGRDDTTNCFVPILSILTNIDNDHIHFLGSTLPEIAAHKAGIIKENVPVILGDIPAEAMPVVLAEIQKQKTFSYMLGKEFHYRHTEGKQKTVFQWMYKEKEKQMTLSMQGEHQVKNCSLAFMALEYLRQIGFVLSEEKIERGIQKAQLSGRFELLQKELPQVILDGAHNVAGVKAFLQTAKSFLANRETEVQVVFSAFTDKEIEKMLEILLPTFAPIILTTFNHPRALTRNEITSYEQQFSKQIIYQPLEDVIESLHNGQTKKADVYFFIGSLHFVAKVRSFFT